jgi:glutathione-independent formaldehyde dehydrogenase
VPFNIGCGFCRNCEDGLTAFCLTVNPDPHMAGAAYGFAGMGPFRGGQADLLRVPEEVGDLEPSARRRCRSPACRRR